MIWLAAVMAGMHSTAMLTVALALPRMVAVVLYLVWNGVSVPPRTPVALQRLRLAGRVELPASLTASVRSLALTAAPFWRLMSWPVRMMIGVTTRMLPTLILLRVAMGVYMIARWVAWSVLPMTPALLLLLRSAGKLEATTWLTLPVESLALRPVVMAAALL